MSTAIAEPGPVEREKLCAHTNHASREKGLPGIPEIPYDLLPINFLLFLK